MIGNKNKMNINYNKYLIVCQHTAVEYINDYINIKEVTIMGDRKSQI